MLTLSRVTFASPHGILYSLPTLCDRLPVVAPATSEHDLLRLHEDDWRQVELISAGLADVVATEFDAVRRVYHDWTGMARTGIAVLRMLAVDNPNDPRLSALVGELSVAYPQLRQWWAARHVAHPEFGTKTIRHPELGDLNLEWDSFT